MDWTFDATWPFEPHWFQTAEGRMHFVDIGPHGAPPIVMLHGNPTWGYIWRNFITILSMVGYRCLVPDHLGFGRSDKPSDAAHYTFEKHADRLNSLLESLDLRQATLIVQDWGAPIGAYWLSKHPDRVQRFIVLNGLAHPLKKPIPLYGFIKLIRARFFGELLEKGLAASVRGYLFRGGVQYPERFSSAMRSAYLAPFPTWASRTAMLQFPRSIPVDPNEPGQSVWREIHDGLLTLRDDQILIIWPMKDPGFTPDLLEEYWVRDFPRARVIRIEDAGHYIQEDAWERVVPAIVRFLAQSEPRPVS
jgi:cis-3-alkyl-4-acyloxetan-2-one decarboxylase